MEGEVQKGGGEGKRKKEKGGKRKEGNLALLKFCSQ